MAVSYEIYPDRAFMIFRYEGHITASESLRGFVESIQDPRWRAGMTTFVDMSRAREIDINFNQMMGMSHKKASLLAEGPQSRIIFWAPHDLAYGIARMYASLNEGAGYQEITVFRDKDEALTFAGIAALT